VPYIVHGSVAIRPATLRVIFVSAPPVASAVPPEPIMRATAKTTRRIELISRPDAAEYRSPLLAFSCRSSDVFPRKSGTIRGPWSVRQKYSA
jgi:hypothetical protein